jgi:hypothetical protein
LRSNPRSSTHPGGEFNETPQLPDLFLRTFSATYEAVPYPGDVSFHTLNRPRRASSATPPDTVHISNFHVRGQNRAAVHFHNYRDWKNEPDVLGHDVGSHKINLLGCVTPVLVTMKVADIGMVSGVSCGFNLDAQQLPWFS